MTVTIDQMKRTLRHRREVRDAANRERWQQAKRDFDSIVGRVAAEYAPTRIYCWGSLLDRRTFNENSDIDIGIEGILDPEQYFRVVGLVASLTEFPVDVVQMEKIDPVFARLIRRKGKVVYERP
jgi:predicted nucleotidyltransferase